MKDTTFLKWLARILHLPAQVGIVRATRLADLMQGENYDERIRPAAMARMYQSHFFRAILNDVRAVEFNTSGASPPPQLGDLPLVVLSRGPDAEYAQIARAWDELQAELAQISTNSIRIIAEESGHYIHRDQPELVIDAIRRVVNDDLR